MSLPRLVAEKAVGIQHHSTNSQRYKTITVTMRTRWYFSFVAPYLFFASDFLNFFFSFFLFLFKTC